MKKFTNSVDSIEDRVGLQLARRLDDASSALAPDIAERLRFSRERALARARASQAQVEAHAAARHPAWLVGGQWALAGGSSGMAGPNLGLDVQLPGESGLKTWMSRLASVLPLLILVLGFLVIQETIREIQIEAATEVDAALLSDDLPPQAYTDPGFAEFLRREGR